MKKILPILFVCIVALIFSCQEEEETPFAFNSNCPSNMILNPDFELNMGCNVNPNNCNYGNIGNCVQNWGVDHGTPHLWQGKCTIKENNVIRCASRNDSEGEGVFQLVSLVPGETYQMCLWIWSGPNTSGLSQVRVSLGNSSPGLPDNSNICRALPDAGFLDVFQENAINFIGGWELRSFAFTVPLESTFDRIILRRIGGAGIARLSSFDNITLFNIPNTPANPAQLLDHCCMERPCT